MKVRYFFLYVVILFILYAFVMIWADLIYIDTAATSIRRTVATAAELALTQAVASDEMFNEGMSDESSVSAGITSVYKANHGADEYSRENLFNMVYKTTEKDTLYRYMYGQNSLFNNNAFMQELCNVKQEVGTYEIPIVARMGLLENGGSMIPNASSTLKDALDNSGYNSSIAAFKTDWLGTKSIQKEYITGDGNRQVYYLAPTNIGITYIDANILETAFVTDMDLLMRAKFAEEKALTQGEGLIESNFDNGLRGADFVITEEAQKNVDKYNIINNGLFGFVKGELSGAVGTGYTGGLTKDNKIIKPAISYKVVNMCDPKNEGLIRAAVTDRAGIHDSSTYTQWLTELGIDTTKPYYCVVAKITFYADVIIEYRTPLTRSLYSLYSRVAGDEHDFFQADLGSKVAAADDTTTSTVTGNPLYAYTTYYAVVP